MDYHPPFAFMSATKISTYSPLYSLYDYLSPSDPLYQQFQSTMYSRVERPPVSKNWVANSAQGEFIYQVLSGNYNQIDSDVGVNKKDIFELYTKMNNQEKTILFHRLVNDNSPLLVSWIERHDAVKDQPLKDFPLIRYAMKNEAPKMRYLKDIMDHWRDTPDW